MSGTNIHHHPTRQRRSRAPVRIAMSLLLVAAATSVFAQTSAGRGVPGRELTGSVSSSALVLQKVAGDDLTTVSEQLRRDAAAELESAARDFGFGIDTSKLAFQSLAAGAFAGAPQSRRISVDALLAGEPFMLWWSSGSEKIPAGYFAAGLDADGTAVLRDRDGSPVARGVGKLVFGGNTGFCSFEEYGDDVCLECDNGFQVAVCFKLQWP